MRFILFFIVGLFPFVVLGQAPQVVADLNTTVRASNVVEYYYAFEKGDRVQIKLKAKKKRLSKFSFGNYEGNTLYQSLLPHKLKKGKWINIKETGVHHLRIENDGLEAQVAQLKINRIPANLETPLSTNIRWETYKDSTAVERTREVLLRSDTQAIKILDQQVGVHSKGSITKKNRTTVELSLPDDTDHWVYWLGVGQESMDAIRDLANTMPDIAKVVSVSDPLIAFALNLIPALPMLNKGQEIDFHIADASTSTAFKEKAAFLSYKENKGVITSYERVEDMEIPENGKIAFHLTNKNLVYPVDVNLKVTAVTIKREYKTETYIDYEVETRKRPIIAE